MQSANQNKLVVLNGPQSGSVIELKHDLAIGRGNGVDVQLLDSKMSRRHAMLETVEGIWQLRDLGSLNGSYVNDVVVSAAVPLRHGDEVRLGDVALRFFSESQADAIPDVDVGLDAEEEAITVTESLPMKESVAPLLPEGLEAKANRLIVRRLQLLSEFAEFLGNAIEVDKLLPRILEKLLLAFPNAERGCVMLCSPDGTNLDPVATIVRPGAKRQMSISRTLSREAIATRGAVISSDVRGDERFDPRHTIIRSGLHTAMCAPMVCENKLLGLIQMDSSDSSSRFSKADLAVLLGFAGHTALALSKAKLHEESLAQHLLQKDLELAGQIQHCFLPQASPSVTGIRFAESYTPAQYIGGDYYDYLEFFKNLHGLAVGDVAGKGVSAALYMAKLSSEVHFHAQGRFSPGAVLTVLNHALYNEMEGGMFVTLILLLLDPEKRKLKISSAGHFPPILRTGNNSVTEIQVKKNFPIGVSEYTEYHDTDYVLNSGDRIVLYTDGVTEALDPKGNFFGKNRLKYAIAHGGESPREVLGAINQAVAAHSAGVPQSDDLTMVCLAVD